MICRLRLTVAGLGLELLRFQIRVRGLGSGDYGSGLRA